MEWDGGDGDTGAPSRFVLDGVCVLLLRNSLLSDDERAESGGGIRLGVWI